MKDMYFYIYLVMWCFDVFLEFCLSWHLFIHCVQFVGCIWMHHFEPLWQGRGSFQAAAPHQPHSHLPDLFKGQLSQLHCQLHPSCAVAESNSLVGLAEGQLDRTQKSKFWGLMFFCCFTVCSWKNQGEVAGRMPMTNFMTLLIFCTKGT